MFKFLVKTEEKPIGLCAFKEAFKNNANKFVYNFNYKTPVAYPMFLR